MKDHASSSNESEDEDEDDQPVMIDESKKSAFTQELAGRDGHLGSAWDAPAGGDRRGWTDHWLWRTGLMEVESAEAD